MTAPRRGSEIAIPDGAGGRAHAYLALPEGEDAPWPAVVVLHEILGLSDDIRRIAGRFAEAGYAALAPDLYDGPDHAARCVARTILSHQRCSGPAVDLVAAARAWLAARDDVDARRIGAAGFCMGGRFALLLGRDPAMRAVAVFYGDIPARAERLAGVCPVIGSYGGRDRPFAGHAERLRSHLERLGVEHEVSIYPQAGHGFMSHYPGLLGRVSRAGPFHAGHDAAAASDGWRRVLAFFETHLAVDDDAPPVANAS